MNAHFVEIGSCTPPFGATAEQSHGVTIMQGDVGPKSKRQQNILLHELQRLLVLKFCHFFGVFGMEPCQVPASRASQKCCCRAMLREALLEVLLVECFAY